MAPVERVSLAILTRNEFAGLSAVWERIPVEAVDEVFAIDAGSTDGTVELFGSKGIRVFHQRRRGLGAAMLEARDRMSGDALIFFHPDGNEEPSDIARIATLLRSGAEFVIASRMMPGARNEEDDALIRPRKWANLGLAIMARVLFDRHGILFSDITNGLRGITTSSFDRMKLDALGLTMDFLMVIRALKLGLPIVEFPTREGRRIGGSTNFPALSTGIAELRLVWQELRRGAGVFDRP